MNLEMIFDDLEAKLLAESNQRITSFSANAETRRVMLQFGHEQNLSLVAPIIGKDFVAGFEEASANWVCAINARISNLQFFTTDDCDLPALRRQPVDLANFLIAMSLPLSVQLVLDDSQVVSATLVGVEHGLVFIGGEPTRAIGLGSLRLIRILENTDRADLQDWSSR